MLRKSDYRVREAGYHPGMIPCFKSGGKKGVEMMEELYRMIEEKIRQSGYPEKLSGAEVYNDLCDQMEEQEKGAYLLMSRFRDDIVLEYNVTIMDDNFDLHTMKIRTGDGQEYLVEFDR